MRTILALLGFVPVRVDDVVKRRLLQCQLALLDAEHDLDSAVCRVAALRLRLARLTEQSVSSATERHEA